MEDCLEIMSMMMMMMTTMKGDATGKVRTVYRLFTTYTYVMELVLRYD